MFRFRSRYPKTFICTTVIIILYCAVIFFVRRPDSDHHGKIIPSSLVNYIFRSNPQLKDKFDCGQMYGDEMFELWNATKFEICTNESTSQISCYLRYDKDVTRRLCLLINTKIRLYEPYYVANTSDISSVAKIQMQNDVVSADCEHVATKYNGINERKMQFDSFFHVDKFKTSRKEDLQCDHTVSHTVFWIWRWDATNAYHFLEDVTNTFLSLTLFNEDPNQVEIAIYDGMTGIVNNPLFTFWSELFPKGVRIIRNNPFPQNTCFRRSISNMYGMRSHFTEFGGFKMDTHCSSPNLKRFQKWATDRLRIERTLPVKNFTLLFISRQQYLPTRTITRVLANEDIIIQTIKSTFPSLNVIRFRLENYTTFKEQAEIAIQGDIMVGVHGAGLVYSLFMAPGSHLIEIFMGDRTSSNRHFHNIASWMDLKHHSIDFVGKAKTPSPELIVKAIDNAVKDLSKTSTTAQT